VPHFQSTCYLSLCHNFALHFGDETVKSPMIEITVGEGMVSKATLDTESKSIYCQEVYMKNYLEN
jgi:hypothetical protein